MLKRINIIFILLFSLLIFSDCSSKKKKSRKKSGKQSLLSRTFHNTSARYNGYFNAKLILNDVIKNIERSHKDDYSDLLPISKTASSGAGSSYSSDLEQVIKKASIAIQLHPKSKWVDDCYLLIGKAHYINGDYETAANTFKFITIDYSEEALEEIKRKQKGKKKSSSKKKKKKGKKKKGKKKKGSKSKGKTAPEELEPLKYTFKHEPAYHEAGAWFVNSSIANGDYEAAREFIANKKEDPTNPKKFLAKLKQSEAAELLNQGKYEASIEPLKESIELTKGAKNKRRIVYILGQVYQKIGNDEEALVAFDQVLKLKPDYVMEFNARLNKIKSFQVGNASAGAQARKDLTKLSKDEKYEEFLDQIHFTLAEIELKEGDRDEAIHQFQLAARNALANSPFKAAAYYELANLFDESKEYSLAAVYYDSTGQSMAKTNTKYESIIKRNTDYVNVHPNYLSLFQSDSVTIKKLVTAREYSNLKDINSGKKPKGPRTLTPTISGLNSSTGSSWYFYNANAKSKGFNDFSARWGGRSSEDNWRRSNKSSFNNDSDEENNDEVTENKKDGKEKKPKSKSSNEDVAATLFKLANNYEFQLKDYKKAEKTYNLIGSKFNGTKSHSAALYALFLMNNNKNATKAGQYKNTILKEFPDSEYAVLLGKNIDIKAQQELEVFYQSTYQKFIEKSYSEVITRRSEAKEKFDPSEKIDPIFDYITAQSIGFTQDKEIYKNALLDVVKNHNGHSVSDKAKETLKLLGETIKDEKKEEKSKSDYILSKDEIHYVIFYFNKIQSGLGRMKGKLADFNSKNFSLEKLKSTSQVYGEKQTIIVRKFANGIKAEEYITEINSSFNYKEFVKETPELFSITKENLPPLLKNNDLEGYLEFYKSNY